MRRSDVSQLWYMNTEYRINLNIVWTTRMPKESMPALALRMSIALHSTLLPLFESWLETDSRTIRGHRLQIASLFAAILDYQMMCLRVEMVECTETALQLFDSVFNWCLCKCEAIEERWQSASTCQEQSEDRMQKCSYAQTWAKPYSEWRIHYWINGIRVLLD